MCESAVSDMAGEVGWGHNVKDLELWSLDLMLDGLGNHRLYILSPYLSFLSKMYSFRNLGFLFEVNQVRNSTFENKASFSLKK